MGRTPQPNTNFPFGATSALASDISPKSNQFGLSKNHLLDQKWGGRLNQTPTFHLEPLPPLNQISLQKKKNQFGLSNHHLLDQKWGGRLNQTTAFHLEPLPPLHQISLQKVTSLGSQRTTSWTKSGADAYTKHQLSIWSHFRPCIRYLSKK